MTGIFYFEVATSLEEKHILISDQTHHCCCSACGNHMTIKGYDIHDVFVSMCVKTVWISKPFLCRFSRFLVHQFTYHLKSATNITELLFELPKNNGWQILFQHGTSKGSFAVQAPRSVSNKNSQNSSIKM